LKEELKMQKENPKFYKRVKQAGQAFKTGVHQTLLEADPYKLKPVKEIEAVLSPFWAWRALNG
jgi:hypothetical protein